MAKVAEPSSLPPRIGVVKRKTPSELRGEQLKRASVMHFTDESPSPLRDSTSTDNSEMDNVPKRPGLSKNPRYINTRLREVFPAKKSRFRILSGKENAKEIPSMEKTSNSENLMVFSNLAAQRQRGISCLDLEGCAASNEVSKDDVLQACQTIAKCSQGNFLSVAELSSAAHKSSGLSAIDMGKALRGMAALEPRIDNGLAADSSERCGNLPPTFGGNFVSECHLPGQKAPLDLTLKTSMRIISSSSVNWSLMRGTMPQFSFQQCPRKGQNMRGTWGFKDLHSWVYPQSILPPSLTSVLSSSTEDRELEFLRKRQVIWEESFRGLYHMLRSCTCGIFYVCTSQFVVMFTGGDGSGSSKCLCNAYISRSTRGLRLLLKENDVYFSMPLCHSKVEQVTTDDLVELSEIEKQNLGQTPRLRSFSDVDNTPQSLLVFSGNRNVHGLYDILLNYRSFISSLSGMDVPVLCSPVPFQNAALSSPDIKFMEMRKAEHIAASYNGSICKTGESAQGSSDSLCCSIEIKDAFLPPWIICGVCTLLGSEGRNFEA
ncbi:uncharacterized protein LOC133316767, partial [Gastrolobium bilobum]|uniref:uncharacterized protein LOC133316767 n=1 Tax=Gastrolobium bilobum TaxID=150636 RepID=UPI002AB183F0